jgi:hypothetical protein
MTYPMTPERTELLQSIANLMDSATPSERHELLLLAMKRNLKVQPGRAEPAAVVVAERPALRVVKRGHRETH